MDMLRRLLGKKHDPLMERADTLVQMANVNAVGAFTPMLGEFPLLRETDTENWDFILTVAGVFMAATRLRNLRVGEAREQKLMNVVYERFTGWDAKNGIRAFEDCKSFFASNFDTLTKRGHEPQFVASDAIGLWIVWNVLGRAPQSEKEGSLVRTVGVLVTHAFFNWWDENA